MKYVWIVMLIIADIIWLIASAEDFIETARRFKIKYILKYLEDYTVGFMLLHLLLLFVYSLSVFIQGMG
jgi:hypothetical protein